MENEKFDLVLEKMEEITNSVCGLSKQFDGLEKRFDGLENKVDSLSVVVKEHGDKIDYLGKLISNNTSRIERLEETTRRQGVFMENILVKVVDSINNYIDLERETMRPIRDTYVNNENRQMELEARVMRLEKKADITA